MFYWPYKPFSGLIPLSTRGTLIVEWTNRSWAEKHLRYHDELVSNEDIEQVMRKITVSQRHSVVGETRRKFDDEVKSGEK